MINEDKNTNNKKLSEDLLSAITDIDDSLIEEADTPASTTGADLIRNNKHVKKYLLIAACFALICVVAIPLITSGIIPISTNYSSDKSATESISDNAIEDSSSLKAESYGSITSNKTDSYISDSSTYPYYADDFKKGEYNIIVNTYNGTSLDDKSQDPQGVLSLMKTCTIENAIIENRSGNCTVISTSHITGDVYIVAISNASGNIMRVYDAETLELLLEAPGSSIGDISLDLGIAG